MGQIKDISLAPEGVKKIEWVRSCMPVLTELESRFKEEQPFKGKRISISIHLEAKTANLALVLRAGGAEVSVTGCNPLSTQDAVAAGLVSLGFEVNAAHGADETLYTEHLAAALSNSPHIILDDGGDFVKLLHGPLKGLCGELIGGCEETTTGVSRLRARAKAGALDFPMMAVNDARCKYLFDNRYGTGQSVWDGIMHTTNMTIAAKTVVVAGYGCCGKGVALRAKGLGADVVVAEVDPFCALEALHDGYRVMKMDDAAKIGDIFVTCTGVRDVITAQHFAVMKDNVILSNAGHFDVEFDKKALAELAVEVFERRKNVCGYRMPDGRVLNLLAEGRLVNLAAGNGHPAEIMDMSFGLQCLTLRYLALNGRSLAPGLYKVPDDIDLEVARLKLKGMGVSCDALSHSQREYLDGWEH